MNQDFVFISESVTEGHPDKLCDQISDAIVDHYLEHDPFARVRAECAVSNSILFIAARFASEIKADIPNLARRVISQVGYARPDFDARTCSILTSLQEYPPDADLIFDEMRLREEEFDRLAARQQATVFGFACRQTESFLPLPIFLAHRLAREIMIARRERGLFYLSPDAKVQVGVEYRRRQPVRLHSLTLVVSAIPEEADNIPRRRLEEDMRGAVIAPALSGLPMQPDGDTRIFINPLENLMVGGPAVHSGLTGRKNATDTYGEYARHSGNALSGKDPLRIDRIGAYAARYAAKNVVAAGLAEECEVVLCYSIGSARPASIQVETFGTGKLSDDRLAAIVARTFDFRPIPLLRTFQLRHLPARHHGVFYRALAAYGQVGRTDLTLPWEATDRVTDLEQFLP